MLSNAMKKAAELHAATDLLNKWIRALQEALAVLGVVTNVTMPNGDLLEFCKFDGAWQFIVTPADGHSTPLANASRAQRLMAINGSLMKLLESFEPVIDHELGLVRQAIDQVSTFTQAIRDLPR